MITSLAAVRRVWIWLAAGLSAVLLLTACSGGSNNNASSGKKPSKPAAQIALAPSANATDVIPSEPVSIMAANGTLTDVSVVAADGAPITGNLTPDKTQWVSSQDLAFSTTYTVNAKAQNGDKKTTSSTSTFTTVTPETLAYPAAAPLDGAVVGVGMPLRIYFGEADSEDPISVAEKEQVLKHVRVTTNPPQEVRARWFNGDTELHLRPKDYWQSGTAITLDVDLQGVSLGNGTFANSNRTLHFTIGKSHISKADTATHQMEIFEDGVLVNTFPISAGRAPDFYTHSGPHVVIGKDRVKTMDSTTFGLSLAAGGYVTDVEYAVRISNSGEFVHSAPWSVSDQGRRNVSHGCLNVSPERAAWFFDFAQPGDVVEVLNSPVQFTETDGDISDWTVAWEEWMPLQ